MPRQIVEMRPTEVGRKQPEDPTERLRRALRGVAEVRPFSEAEEPILAPSVRQVMFQWLSEIRAEDDLAAVGVKPRSTALLYGPPGCGKTSLAHHLAARLGMPLVIVGPETIISSGWGNAEQNLTKLFSGLAAAEAPCVVFVDELEAIGGSRDKNTHGSADNARTSLLTVLLRKIEEYPGYFCGATNRPQDIDQALWRRFHLQIPIELPNADERFAIMRRYGLPFQFQDDDLDLLTAVTDGASPALLRGLMEGIKRSLVVRPRIRLPIDDPWQVIGPVISALAPPPEIEPPPLWDRRDARDRLKEMTWPPVQREDAVA